MATKTWQFPQRSEARGLAMTSSCQQHTFTQDFTHSRLPHNVFCLFVFPKFQHIPVSQAYDYFVLFVSHLSYFDSLRQTLAFLMQVILYNLGCLFSHALITYYFFHLKASQITQKKEQKSSRNYSLVKLKHYYVKISIYMLLCPHPYVVIIGFALNFFLHALKSQTFYLQIVLYFFLQRDYF